MGLSIAQALVEAADSLRQAGVAEARQDAGLLLAHILNCDRTFIITHAEEILSDEALQAFVEVVNRRAAGEPAQYVTGRQAFFRLEFEVTKDVLIPRPETELLVETALGLLRTTGAPFICDVGTGSGCIAISLLHEIRNARAIGIDLSPPALCVARRNASRNAVADRFHLMASDCFSGLKAVPAFSMIVSNPPYVAETAVAGLQREVCEYEPRVALTAGREGLSVIRRLLVQSPEYLVEGGHLLLEIGFDQHDALARLIDRSVWEVLDIHKDLQGIPRTVALRKK